MRLATDLGAGRLLAELMLPEGVHDVEQDWTVFMTTGYLKTSRLVSEP